MKQYTFLFGLLFVFAGMVQASENAAQAKTEVQEDKTNVDLSPTLPVNQRVASLEAKESKDDRTTIRSNYESFKKHN